MNEAWKKHFGRYRTINIGMGGDKLMPVAAPGKLLVRETNGTIRTLVDGSKPTTASLNLIDVSAPNVSYDATKIVFAGFLDFAALDSNVIDHELLTPAQLA